MSPVVRAEDGDDRQAKTLVEKLGFMDPDLKSPKHDAMMVWAHENMAAIAQSVYGPQPGEQWPNIASQKRAFVEHAKWLGSLLESDNRSIYRYRDHLLGWLDQWAGKPVPEPPERVLPRILSIKWEQPITTSTRYIVGYLDLMVILEIGTLHVAKWVDLTDKAKETAPVADWEILWERRRLAIELKTSIQSIGELLRQINTYKTHMPYSDVDYVVISPDARYADILNHQCVKHVLFTGDDQ